MPVIEQPEQFGNTIFCDDFRQDIQGKFIYTGVYHSDMVVYGVSPVLVASFWVVVKYSIARALARGTAVVKVFLPKKSEPLLSADVNLDMLQQIPEPNYRHEEDDTRSFLSCFVPIRISPLIIEHEGFIRVRAYRGDDETRLGSLPVSIATIPTFPFQVAPNLT